MPLGVIALLGETDARLCVETAENEGISTQALRRTPIVAVSAYGADKYRSIALEAGCNEYVSTPFDPGALAELIKSLIAQRDTDLPSDLEH